MTPPTIYLPGDYTQPEYTITDPATIVPVTAAHKVAIVYSGTSAGLYFNQTAYSDLIMAAENQCRMAGVPYDLIDESKLTDVNNLTGYSALVFPAMADVNTAQLPAIMKALNSAVYNYHIGIIAAGDFLTNDQTGAPLAGNSYANMQALLGLGRVNGGNGAAVTVTAADVANPIMKSYTAGQVIQSYPSESYAYYAAATGVTSDVLVNQNVSGGSTVPGVIQTTTGGTNVHFATASLLGDSNLLSNAIQGVVGGTQAGVELNISRQAGIVALRMDMDQSQYPADVSPVNAAGVRVPGIYDTLIPILQQWHQQYNFVGSYFINLGDNPQSSTASPEVATTNWAVSGPYYKALQAIGGEIGTHSYTHLINPPTTVATATTASATAAGSTTITLNTLPSFAGVTVGMVVSGLNIGANTPVGGVAGEGGAVANTIVTAVSGNTVTISYVPGGFTNPTNAGVLGAIPAGTSLSFSVPAENTNFLQTTAGATGSNGDPFTYAYEFNDPKAIIQTNLGTPVYGAAIPGANETYATDQNILPYYQSGSGYTGYLTGGWTGIGSGYPSAIGYMSPSATDLNSVYIAPNMTFDFTEIQYQGKTVAQAEADWAAQFAALQANAAGTPIAVLPVHDYGVAAWNTTTDTGTGSPYTTQMFTDFIAAAYAKNQEFLTLEELASRISAQQKAAISYATVGNTVTATVTPNAAAPDVGEMALKVVNGGTQVIQNVTNWYAYNAQELLLKKDGGTFAINLGTTQDAVTHITTLPMRADLVSVTGDGLNLSFSVVGSGDVIISLGTRDTSVAPVVTDTATGTTIASLTGDLLDLSLSGSGQHNVTLKLAAPPPAVTAAAAPPTEVVTAAALSVDAGSSATDFITNVATQTITVTLSAALATGNLVKVSLDNGVTWQTATAVGSSTTSFALSNVTLAGSGTLKAQVVNASGLASAAYSHTYTIDLVPPSEVVTIASMTLDTGASATDFITNNGAANRIVSGTLNTALAAGELLQVSFDNTTWSTATVTGTTWTATDSSSHTTGWTIQARVADLAGNLGAVVSKPVTLDTIAPSAPVFTGLTTNQGAATLAGTGEAASKVTVLVDGAAQITTATVGAGGTWSFTTGALATGSVHIFTATATDTAGNQSATFGSAQLGTSGANTLTSTAGTDILRGGAGADTFVFNGSFGKDVIADFAATGSSHDFIRILGNTVLNNFTAVMAHATQVGSNVLITQDANNTITLSGITRTSLTSADFKFV